MSRSYHHFVPALIGQTFAESLLGSIVTVASLLCGSDFALSSTTEKSGVWLPDTSQSPNVRVENQTSHNERGVEFVRFKIESSQDIERVRLISRQPAALPHEDFLCTVAISSSQKGVQLALRVVFPNHTDPRSGKPMVGLLMGTRSDQSDQWQTLSVEGTEKAVRTKVRQLRAATLQSDINSNGVYFDGCVLITEVHKGDSYVDIGETGYGPVASPKMILQGGETAAAPHKRVEVARDQIIINGRAVFPRFMPDHGESTEFLNRLGVNALWIASLRDTERMQRLVDADIAVIATPPHPEFDPADFDVPLQGLPPLEEAFPLPSIWYFGTNVDSDQMSHLLAWGREVRSADRQLRRPLMADVRTSEGVASRQIDFVGISQHVSGGLRSFGEARNRSHTRQKSSAQLILPWEWVQTEPSASLSGWRTATGSRPLHIEPEQITMQTVALLSAGSRGIGFWKSRALSSSTRSCVETAKAVELANLYLDILEPLLVQGRIEGHINVEIPDSQGRPVQRESWLTRTLGGSDSKPTTYADAPSGPDAALIDSPGTSLILAGFWDQESHFVPQSLYAPTAQLTVGATETASAWRVSATGVHGLRRQPTAGGLRLQLKDFDQLAMVLVSSDRQVKQSLEQRIHRNAERAANLFVDLAELKLARVERTCREIDNSFAGPDTSVPRMFSQAEASLGRAKSALEQRNFPSAERYSSACMRETRQIQNRYWYRAVQSLPTPMASPHTISFSSLIDHWHMMESIQRGVPSENLVPSGSFENLRLLSEGKWKPISPQEDRYYANADIVTEHRGDNQLLRIRAWRREASAGPGEKPSILVRSPEITAVKGAVYEVTGRVKLGLAVPPDHESPFLIFDSDLGPEFSVRPQMEPSWRTFRVLRQASETGPFKIWMAITGAAEVFVDDVVVRQLAGDASSQVPTTDSGLYPDESLKRSRVQGAGYSNPSFP